MGIPLKIQPKNLDDYLEIMSKAVFQAGLSWASIDKRWMSFVEAFDKFETEKVAKMSLSTMDKLLSNEALLINEKKLEAVIHNAQTLLALNEEYQGFANYLRAFNDYYLLAKDLKKRFKYLGDLNVYYFLFRVNEAVPPFLDWIKTIKGEHPRMQEMVEAAKMKKSENLGDAINARRSALLQN